MKCKWVFMMCAILPGYVLAAVSATEEYRSVDHLAKQANYIFEGTVAKIEYRFSEPHAGQKQGVPYTFVTYNIDKEFKNTNTNGSKQVTLKFIGGPINDNEFIRTSNMPLMDIGDTDLLFVDSADSPCPLVDCMKGRFRNINNVMFDEQGRTIVADSDGRLRSGQAVKLDEVMNHKMTDSMQLTLEEDTPEDLLESIEDLEILTERQGFRPDPVMFGSLIEDAVIANHSPEELAQLTPIQNQDASKPFKDKAFDPANIASAPLMDDEAEQNDANIEADALVIASTLKQNSLAKMATLEHTRPTTSASAIAATSMWARRRETTTPQRAGSTCGPPPRRSFFSRSS